MTPTPPTTPAPRGHGHEHEHDHSSPEHGCDHHGSAPSPAEQARLGRRAQLLAGLSVGYNTVEAVVAVGAGAAAGSAALVSFGLDSVVEVSSGLIIVWQFRHQLPRSRERRALRLIALSLWALAGYVTQDAVRSLLSPAEPDASPVGIALALASLVVMPFLSAAQRRTGRALHSEAVVADATQTLLCTYLSAVLLVGLVLNAALGWSWADPVAGLVIAAVAVKEGLDAWRGEGCCGPAATPGAPASHESCAPPAERARELPAEAPAAACLAGCCS